MLGSMRGARPATIFCPIKTSKLFRGKKSVLGVLGSAGFGSNRTIATSRSTFVPKPTMMSSAFPDLGSKNGQIQVIFGPMFSGKTTELMRRVQRYRLANYDCVLIKYAKDIRYDAEAAATHDGRTYKALSATKLSDLREDLTNVEVIGIDEGQFFPDTVSFSEEMANMNKIVIVAALDGSFQKKAFGNLLDLVPLAESVVKLTAVCMICYQEAAFTKRITTETEIEIIGGSDKYIATCRACYGMPMTKQIPNKLDGSGGLPSPNKRPKS